jgi:hypothetical protein
MYLKMWRNEEASVEYTLMCRTFLTSLEGKTRRKNFLALVRPVI